MSWRKYQDKAGHFTSEENDGGECLHNGKKKDYADMSIAELKGITQKEYRQNTPYEEILTVSKKKRREPKSKEEFFGLEYTGVKGREAVDKLLEEKQGHVKAAFYRKEIGDIDLVWGDEDAGLSHVIKRRDEMYTKGTGTIRGIEMAEKIPEIIENGAFVIDKKDRLGFEFQGLRVGIKPDYLNEQLNWIISAMEIL